MSARHCRLCGAEWHDRRRCPTRQQQQPAPGPSPEVRTELVQNGATAETEREGERQEDRDLDFLRCPDGTSRPVVLVVRGYSLDREGWDNTVAWLCEDFAVLEARTVGEAVRMAYALQPDAIFVDGLPAVSMTENDTLKLVEALRNVAPSSGIAVIVGSWMKRNDLERAFTKASADFFGYATEDKTSTWIVCNTVNRARKKWSREHAQRLGFELH